MIKKLICVFSLILLIISSGCSETRVKLHIESPIDAYAPYMSSVPGFPLDVMLEIRGNEPMDLTVTLETDRGTFLEWGDDMKVRDIGSKVEYIGETIYWSPFEADYGVVERAGIVSVASFKGAYGQIDNVATVMIVINDEGLYVLDTKD